MIKLFRQETKSEGRDFQRIEGSVISKRHKNAVEMAKMQKEFDEMNKRVSDKLTIIRRR